jgi:hypothetical protein
MSNIFYSEVDKNLQQELNRRGQAGGSRTTADLNWMLGKTANAEIRAYEGNSIEKPVDSEYGILGGQTVLDSRFQPITYLADQSYTTTGIAFNDMGRAEVRSNNFVDSSRRVAPYITDVSVAIGDHSMGLLNKATIKLEIPNPQRDLDGIEDIWFRPGRYVQIKIAHPESAVITGLHLDPGTLPNEEELKKKYPDIKWDTLSNQVSSMNEYSFLGLITSFTFSYNDAGFVEASLSLTGTSNSYTDVSMYIPKPPPDDKNKAKVTPVPEKPTTAYDIGIVTATSATTASQKENSAEIGVPNFYEQFAAAINEKRDRYIKLTTNQNALIPWTDTVKNTDQFIIFGDAWKQTTTELQVESKMKEILKASGSSTDGVDDYFPEATYSRYITLGAVIDFINTTIIKSKFKQDSNASIIFSDVSDASNYYNNVVSCNPLDVLFISKTTTQENGGNQYGTLKFFENVKIDPSWPGYTDNLNDTTVIRPSRIFINEQAVKRIYTSLDKSSKGKFLLKEFIKDILLTVNAASGQTIGLNLITHPTNQNQLLITDTKYLRAVDKTKIEPKKEPYSVPMFANHPNGSIVSDFKFDASLPESAKNLSYVLNQGTDISEDDIAPHMNFMYNAKNADAVNKLMDKYTEQHKTAVINLANTRAKVGLTPSIPEITSAYAAAIKTFLKFPTPDINKSKQMTAPIFPFTVEFTIDGVNGLRYGDILTFDALPTKYKVNTVFSIIGITQSIGSDGIWTTAVRCIMRPRLD